MVIFLNLPHVTWGWFNRFSSILPYQPPRYHSLPSLLYHSSCVYSQKWLGKFYLLLFFLIPCNVGVGPISLICPFFSLPLPKHFHLIHSSLSIQHVIDNILRFFGFSEMHISIFLIKRFRLHFLEASKIQCRSIQSNLLSKQMKNRCSFNDRSLNVFFFIVKLSLFEAMIIIFNGPQ